MISAVSEEQQEDAACPSFCPLSGSTLPLPHTVKTCQAGRSCSTSAGGQQPAVTLCGEGNCCPAWGTHGGAPQCGIEVAVVAGANPGLTRGSTAVPAAVS